jgi:Zn-dependent protease with chaperone function
VKHLALLYLFCLFVFIISAQTSFLYRPITDDSLKNKQTFAAIRQKFINDSTALDGEYKKDYRAIYSDRFQTIKNMFDEKAVVETPKLTGYINSLLEEIYQSNPQIRALSPRILVVRNYWPNAFSLGDGTIVINIGLIHRLDNEAQLVFTLCHELAHLYLKHTDKRIENYVTTVNSKEYQKQLKQIQKAEYLQRQQAEQLAKRVMFKSRSHSRENETEADAKALELMKTTRFDINQIITTLELLDKIDDEETGTGLQLDKIFNFSNHPFQPRWIEKGTSFFAETKTDEKTRKEIDSLKTHPDCSRRIELITPKIKQAAVTGQRFVVSEKFFHEWQQLFRYEAIEYCYTSKSISKALFYALQMIQQTPEDLYLQTMIGKCLNECYTAQKDHVLNRIAELPNPAYDEQYNQLLRFIQNVRLVDFAAISYYYLQQFEEAGKADEEFMYAFIHSKSNFNKPEEKSKWITYYIQYFQNRKYSF